MQSGSLPLHCCKLRSWTAVHPASTLCQHHVTFQKHCTRSFIQRGMYTPLFVQCLQLVFPSACRLQAPPLIVPRVIVELAPQALLRFLQQPEATLQMVVDEIVQQGLDGLVRHLAGHYTGPQAYTVAQHVTLSYCCCAASSTSQRSQCSCAG